MREHRGRLRGVASALGIAAVVTLAGAACTTGGGTGTAATPYPTPSVAKVTAAEIASAVTTPGETTPVGGWAQVFRSAGNDGGTDETYLVRVAGVVQGTPGEFKDVQLTVRSDGPSLKTAVPYFIALQFAVIKGDPVTANGPGLATAVDAGDDEHIADLQGMTDRDTQCDPAPLTGDAATASDALNAIRNTCSVAVSDPGAQYAPTLLHVGLTDDPTGYVGPAAIMQLPAPTTRS